MGKQVKIKDLAKQMILLSGLSIKDEFNPEGYRNKKLDLGQERSSMKNFLSEAKL